jgi:hypothetical protein
MSPMMPGMSPEDAEMAYAQQGAPPAGPGGPPPGGDPGMAPGGAPPETLDGPAEPGMPIGVSLNPAQMAAIALQAVAEIAGIDLQAFQAGQAASMEQVPGAIQAIMAQLQMQAAQPETLDGPVGAEEGMVIEQQPAGAAPGAMNPEEEPGAILA